MAIIEQERRTNQVPISMDLKNCIDIGVEFAVDGNSGNLDSRCLLLGLLAGKFKALRTPEVISGTLLLFGIKPMKPSRELVSGLTRATSQKLTVNEDVKGILKLAREHAQRSKAKAVTPHHMLIAIVEYGEGVAAKKLDMHGLGKNQLLQLKAISEHPAFFSGFTPPKALSAILKDPTINPVEKNSLAATALTNSRR